MVPKKIKKTLEIIYSKLKDKNIKWVLVGSLSLALQGVKIRPKDIDILTDKKGAFEINKILKEYQKKAVKFKKSKFFKSYFGEFNIGGVKVEIMGNLREKVNNRWFSFSKRLISPKIVKFGNISVPVSSLKDQLKSYERGNRKKDLIYAKKIREALKI